MRQTLSRGVFVAAAATSVLSLYANPALADTFANGSSSGSPGVLSGNTVQAPIDVPVNACGNTVDVVAGLNPAFGNSCAGQANATATTDTPTPSTPPVRSTPEPGSGDEQPPAGDYHTLPAPTDKHSTPPGYGEPEPGPTFPPPRGASMPPAEHMQPHAPELAQTGAGALLATSAASAALIAGGAVLYRRARSTARR
ncbi:chaplin [Streptomyces sp. NPDC014864]|uniref:chaplin n=1 Tax=Streptomyces sp. NPDC014864 TaxID=3364924 RepID=UPI0036F7EE0B